MIPKRRLACVAVVALFGVTAWASAQSMDPLVGTWQLNLSKSKYSPGPAPRSATTIVEAAGSGYKFSVRQAPTMGAVQEWSFTTNADGKPVKITGNSPNGDMITYTKINAYTFETVTTKGGKETQRQKIVISADGKTRTVTSSGTDGSGRSINNVAVYDRK